jgi:hypothetical protein
MKRTLQRALEFSGCLLGVFVIWVLSIGPAFRLTVDTRFEDTAAFLYEPVMSLGASSPAFLAYLRLWDLYHPCEHSTPVPGKKISN